MTQFNYKIANAKNRALVCYCNTDNGDTMKRVIKDVFENQSIDIEPFIDGGGSIVWTDSNVVTLYYGDSQTNLNIALRYNDVIKRLKVVGKFTNVSIGIFLYDQPPTPEPEITPDDDTTLEEDIEPEPSPSITSLVCDALRETFGGVYGASAFVIPNTVNDFVLKVE